MRQAIRTEDLVAGEYYWGYWLGEDREPRTCRWDGSGPCFVTWERSIGGGRHLIDLSCFEFEALEVVTWGTDEIPLED